MQHLDAGKMSCVTRDQQNHPHSKPRVTGTTDLQQAGVVLHTGLAMLAMASSQLERRSSSTNTDISRLLSMHTQVLVQHPAQCSAKPKGSLQVGGFAWFGCPAVLSYMLSYFFTGSWPCVVKRDT